MMGRPRTFSSPEAFEKAAEAYFEQCRANGEPVLLTGLILALGFAGKSSFYAYGRRLGFEEVVRRARTTVEMEYEKALRTSSASGPIFALKNFGWNDKPEQASQTDCTGHTAVSFTVRWQSPAEDNASLENMAPNAICKNSEEGTPW